MRFESKATRALRLSIRVASRADQEEPLHARVGATVSVTHVCAGEEQCGAERVHVWLGAGLADALVLGLKIRPFLCLAAAALPPTANTSIASSQYLYSGMASMY